jgi:DNA adenine methylase
VVSGTRSGVAPILKWVGGKRQLLPEILPLIPNTYGRYLEPFVGGGAVLFALGPHAAWVNDLNRDLIELYEVVRDDVEGLIDELRRHSNDAGHFYDVRHWDRDPNAFRKLSKRTRAARMVFLNKTCYNGLYRVNSAGEFNAPFGRYSNPNIVDEKNLRAASTYFKNSEIVLNSANYESVLDEANAGDFVYLDPPYDPVSATSNFTGYVQGGFGRAEQERLYEVCVQLSDRGAKVMHSNAATPYIVDRYASWNVQTVRARRNVNSNSARRGVVDEVIIRNYR